MHVAEVPDIIKTGHGMETHNYVVYITALPHLLPCVTL